MTACCIVKLIPSMTGTEILQNDLLCLEHWWFMKFNRTNHHSQSQSYTYTLYSLYDQELNQVQEAKYLQVLH